MNQSNEFGHYYGVTQVVSFSYQDITYEDGSTRQWIEVVFRKPSNMWLMTYPAQKAPDDVWMDVYEVVDGKLVLSKKLIGKHTPGYTVFDSFTFSEETK